MILDSPESKCVYLEVTLNGISVWHTESIDFRFGRLTRVGKDFSLICKVPNLCVCVCV